MPRGATGSEEGGARFGVEILPGACICIRLDLERGDDDVTDAEGCRRDGIPPHLEDPILRGGRASVGERVEGRGRRAHKRRRRRERAWKGMEEGRGRCWKIVYLYQPRGHWVPPKLLERRIEDGPLAAERADVKVASGGSKTGR